MNKKTSYIYVYLIVCLSFVAHLSLLYKISGAKIVDRAFQVRISFFFCLKKTSTLLKLY